MFEKFVKKISEEIKGELPGFSAQKLMAPLGRRPPLDYLKEGITPKKSAVLILLYPQIEPFAVKTVLILRPENEGGNHAGQVSFPGGGFDESDKDLSETALREAEEEVGVDRNLVSLIGALTPLYIPVSNFMVHPFIGVMNSSPEFTLHPLEVSKVLEVDVNDFISDARKGSIDKFMKVLNAKMQVPCYNIEGETVWGATAMIISELEELLKRMAT